MKPASVELRSVQGVARVRQLELPPSRYQIEVDSFYPGYYEWLTPTLYEKFWRANSPAGVAPAGVGYAFANSSPRPVTFPARAYATFETPSGTTPVRGNVVRRGNRIVIDLESGEGGATLVVLEQYFPGWRVKIDEGDWQPPQEADGFMRVALDPAAKRVEFRFQPSSGAAGRGVSVLAVFGLVAYLFGVRFRQR